AALLLAAVLCVPGGAALGAAKVNIGYSLAGVGLLLAMQAAWWRSWLRDLPPTGSGLMERISSECLTLLKPGVDYTPYSLWEAIRGSGQTLFITNHLLLPAGDMQGCFSEDPAALPAALAAAVQLADQYKSRTVEAG